MKLLQEAQLDDKFNKELGKIQDALTFDFDKITKAISALNDIAAAMTAPGSTTKPVKSQATAIRYASENLRSLAGVPNSTERSKFIALANDLKDLADILSLSFPTKK